MSRDQPDVMPMMDDQESSGSWETDAEEESVPGEQARCLFSDDVLPSSAAALEHDHAHFGFDFAKYVSQVGVPPPFPHILKACPSSRAKWCSVFWQGC